MEIEKLTVKKLKVIDKLRNVDGYAMLAQSNLSDAADNLKQIIDLAQSVNSVSEYLEFEEIKDLILAKDIATSAINQLKPCIATCEYLDRMMETHDAYRKLLEAYNRLYRERKEYRKGLKSE